jgi:hypothetical protein
MNDPRHPVYLYRDGRSQAMPDRAPGRRHGLPGALTPALPPHSRQQGPAMRQNPTTEGLYDCLDCGLWVRGESDPQSRKEARWPE